jgi:hypothetical protein
MNKGPRCVLLMKKNGGGKSRASFPLTLHCLNRTWQPTEQVDSLVVYIIDTTVYWLASLSTLNSWHNHRLDPQCK